VQFDLVKIYLLCNIYESVSYYIVKASGERIREEKR
jgi:hypothetical protein